MRLIAKLLKFFANRVRRQGGNPIGEGRWRRWSLFLRLFNWDPSQVQYPRSQYHYRGPRIDYWGPPHEVRVIANAARLCRRTERMPRPLPTAQRSISPPLHSAGGVPVPFVGPPAALWPALSRPGRPPTSPRSP